MDIEKEYINYINTHKIESKKSALEVTLAIQNSELNAGGPNYTRTLHIPKFFSQEDKKNFQNIVQVMYEIFTKTIEAYRKDDQIRSLFPFSKTLEDLILLEPTYSCPIPICRIDIFYNEETKDFYFCEFNTDGTSAMNENRRLNALLSLNNVYQQDTREYEILELVESWADELLKICKEDKSVCEKPMIAIVDILENAYLNELYIYQSVFSHRGYVSEVLDLRDLVYENGALYSKYTHRKIDVIYRRAVTRDIMEYYDEIQPFIQAVKNKEVCLIGPLHTQIIHHKEISKVLLNPIMQKYFTSEENEFLEKHMPATFDLKQEVLPQLEQKDNWIIKPKDGFGAKGVWAGVDVSEEQWKQVLQESVDQHYIVQKYITPYQSKNIDLVNHDDFMMYSNLTGLYVYNGQFAGVYSRCSDGGIISTQYNEKTIPTLFTKE